MSAKRDKIFPTLQLTDACNKSCNVCLRSPDAAKHRLSFDELRAYVDDLGRLSEGYVAKYQFITGGEPTLWKDTGHDIVDVLATVKATGLVETLTMPTNGKLFEDIHVARDLLRRLSDQIDGSIVIGVSVAGYQSNLDSNGCRARALSPALA